jgi:hypothetical protein
MKKIQGLLAATLVTLAFAATSAQAATYDFTYSGDGVSANGSFTTASAGSTPTLVTSITGTYSDPTIANGTIDGLVALHTDGGFNYNDLFGGSPQFDNNGLLFDVNGTQHVNLYTVGNDYFSYSYGNVSAPNSAVDVTITAVVPEPASLALLLAGLGALGFASRRKNVG